MDIAAKPTIKPTIHYEQLMDKSWQCDWWEGRLRYGARGKTKEESLKKALEFKRQGLCIEFQPTA